jgi:predicted PurR-regulated permease PerM
MTQKQLFILSFFVFFIIIFVELLGIFRIFMTPLLWAVILALVFYPLYERLLKVVKGRKNIASALTVLVVAMLTVGPMILFTGTLVKEALGFYQDLAVSLNAKRYEGLWENFLDSPLRHVWDSIAQKTANLNIQIVPLLGRAAQQISESVVNQVQSGAKNFLFFVLNYFITIFIFFFFLRDGNAMAHGLIDLFPMTHENKRMVFQKLSDTVTAVVHGLVITGGIQAVLGGLAFWVLGVPFPLFLAMLIAFLALVPIGGAILVWCPAAAYLFLSGHGIKGLILFIWGTVIVSMVDNVVKPLVISNKTNLPTLFLFLAILGGLSFYGLIGIFLGPIILALFLSLIEIYRKEYGGA